MSKSSIVWMTLLVTALAAILISNFGAPTPAPATPPTAAAVVDTRSTRSRWFDENRVDVDDLRTLGFTMVSLQPGLVLLQHDGGACFLAPNIDAPYIQVEESMCAETHRRSTSPLVDLYGNPVPR